MRIIAARTNRKVDLFAIFVAIFIESKKKVRKKVCKIVCKITEILEVFLWENINRHLQ